jgi:hypothetical protein
MWYVLHLIARPFEVLIGLFCLVTAILLYPNQEGKIQSKLEDFWIRLDDYRLSTDGRIAELGIPATSRKT